MPVENLTPDTLDECDREYDRLDDLYRIRKPVLDAFEQWKLLAQQYAEFQVGFIRFYFFWFINVCLDVEKIDFSCTFSRTWLFRGERTSRT